MKYQTEHPTLYTSIGERIILARRRAGLSQRELGQRLGVSHAAVSDIERAQTRPNLDNLAVIAEAIGVPLGQLVVIPATCQDCGMQHEPGDKSACIEGHGDD